MRVPLKRDGQLFRIWFSWVRDEFVPYHGLTLGNGSIQTGWKLRLRPVNKLFPEVRPPFVWNRYSREQSIQSVAHPDILTEPWLRRVIQKKLAIESDT